MYLNWKGKAKFGGGNFCGIFEGIYFMNAEVNLAPNV
jgi:hypothetical protein